MSKYTYRELDTAHQRSSCHGHLVDVAKDCACFRCLGHFEVSEIKNWIGEGATKTAMCPRCFMDTVLIEDKLDRVPDDLLQAMQDEYFGPVMSDEEYDEYLESIPVVSAEEGYKSFEALWEQHEKERSIRLFEADLILADRAEKANK